MLVELYLTPVPGFPGKTKKAWTGVINIPQGATPLDHIFQVFNQNHPPDYSARSLSVGDEIFLTDHSGSLGFRCENFGWSPI